MGSRPVRPVARFWRILWRYAACGTLGGVAIGAGYAVAYLIVWGVVRAVSGDVGGSGIRGVGDVPLAILGMVYICLIAAGWGVVFALPTGAAAGLTGGILGGLVALGFSFARPGEDTPGGYPRAAGVTAAAANAAVCLYILPRVWSASGAVGSMTAGNQLSVVVLPALVAAWAGWSARHRLSAWYRGRALSEHPT